jgi:hypothetical protein
MLDRSLPCWDPGRKECLLIHDPLEEMETLGVSAMVATDESPCLDNDGLLLRGFGEVIWAVLGR